jgi:hypothetical protein
MKLNEKMIVNSVMERLSGIAIIFLTESSDTNKTETAISVNLKHVCTKINKHQTTKNFQKIHNSELPEVLIWDFV